METSAIVITVGSFRLEIQQSILVWFGICILLGIFFVYAGNRISKADPTKPSKGLVYLCQEGYNIFVSIAGGNLKERTHDYLPLLGTLMLGMAFSNLIGLTGLQNPTSNVSFNATLAILFFILIQYNAIKKAGLKHRLKELAEPNILLAPLNLIGELSLPVSLTMRLFGNILAGAIILMLAYTVVTSIPYLGYLGLLITPLLHAYFDVFSGLIQTYIFFTLGTYFLGEHASRQSE